MWCCRGDWDDVPGKLWPAVPFGVRERDRVLLRDRFLLTRNLCTILTIRVKLAEKLIH